MGNILEQLVNMFKPKAHDSIDGLIEQVRASRPEERSNWKGVPFINDFSTHIMEYGGKDDSQAWPSLFYNPRPLEEGQEPWLDLSGRDDWKAYEEAQKRGELYNFSSPEQALWFSKEIGGHN
tara:strand:- start:222 stop:587 length:366 start_codon:yes stop_codon:yes gene_type:complete